MYKSLNNIRNYSYLRKAGFILSIFWVAIAIIALFSSTGTAHLNTKCCTDCHVFHAREDKEKKEKASKSKKLYASSKKLYASTLELACEGCHTSKDSKTLVKSGENTIPIVKCAKEPEVSLAGGNFYYSSGRRHLKKTGHCTSCHKDVRHHATEAGYRFLGKDIEGIGDPMYEYGDGHNIYKSGNQYCIACHANFCGSKNQRSGAGWIRHPTNSPLPLDGEYAGYKAYRKDVPVCYPDLKKPERSTARVMCMSCHRPHGTPYNFLLRWDYNTMLAGSGNNSTGCFACHTTKDTWK
jgi:predicted CXXCH cytochrome family protein